MPRKTALTAILLAALAICGTLALPRLSTIVGSITYPFERGIHLVKHEGWGRLKVAFDAFLHYSSSDTYRQEVARLRIANELQDAVLAENTYLKELLGYQQQSPHNLLPAPVLSEGGLLGVSRTLRIAKGSYDGVQAGQAVLSPYGLVGRIRAVGYRHAEVLLITHPDCRVAVETQPTDDAPRFRGILTGGGNHAAKDQVTFLYNPDPLRLRYLQREADILPRTRVVTSGLGGLFPAGILVGWVLESFVPEPELYREATILPAAEMSNLDVVFVLTEGQRREQAK